MMEMHDFLFIQLGRDRGRTFIRKFDTKSPFDGATAYVNYDEYRRVYDELKQENDENCRLLGKSAERELALLAEIDRLKAKLAKTEWQPIETAPRDGTVFDVYTKYGRVTNCVACRQFGRIYSYDQESDNYDKKVNFATHWMPLPQPPTTEETK